jgi:signal transduction histidine kinase
MQHTQPPALLTPDRGQDISESAAWELPGMSTKEALRAYGQFVAIAAHELRTPITAVLGYAQLLKSRPAFNVALSHQDQQAVLAIVDQVTRLNRRINMLLDISRIQSGHFAIERKQIDIVLLMRRMVEELHQCLENHVVELTGVNDVLIIEGDELALEEVFQNLLQNAVAYSPNGTLIRVSLERQQEHVCITVEDHGMGIPPAARSRLFECFYRVENDTGNPGQSHSVGMGIGLYVVKNIIDRHGGTIEVTSIEGEGSTFIVCLPLISPVQTRNRDTPT